MAEIVYLLGEVETVLAALPNSVVTTPSGPTMVKDVTGHAQRLLRRFSETRSRQHHSNRTPMPSSHVESICAAPDNLLAAIDGVTNQFDDQASALRHALRRTSAALPSASRRDETA